MKRIRIKVVVGVLFLTAFSSKAQLSPPGIDGAKVVGWGAIGLQQQLGEKWSLSFYTGGSRQSDPDNTRLLQKAAIFVVNQETRYTFNQHWRLALGTSIRIQKNYSDERPYDLDQPSARNELRYYLRLFYQHSINRVAMSYSFRPEYRDFYANNWDKWSTPLELRFRLKGQANIPLNQAKTNQLIIANEFLSTIDHYNNASSERWTSFHFTEDRLTNYFRHTFQKPALCVDVGMMHQFWKEKASNQFHYTAYLSLDLLFINPFGSRA